MNGSYREAVCPVCSQADSYFIRQYKYHNPIFAGCAIVGCNHCTMAFAYPLPAEDALLKYNQGYFNNAHGGMATHPLTVAFHSAIGLLRVLHVRSYVEKNKVPIQTVLEIGPGGGHFAKHWRKLHPETTRYVGVESDTSCHDNLRQYNVEVYADPDAVPENLSFDLVVISHVLEHTTHPVAFINSCTEKLSPGGILFVEVPCNDYQHKDVDEPHLLFFDKEPMRLLFQKSGYDRIRLSYHGNTITHLSKGLSFFDKLKSGVRNALLARGFVKIYAGTQAGLEEVDDPLERAVIKPFKAHIEQGAPAWWLRAIGTKK